MQFKKLAVPAIISMMAIACNEAKPVANQIFSRKILIQQLTPAMIFLPTPMAAG